MNTLLERVRIPVTAPVAGVVIRWKKRPGDTVQEGQEIALFDDGEGPLVLHAPSSGVLGKTVTPGAAVPRNGSLAYITPPEARHSAASGANGSGAPGVTPERATTHSAPQSEFKPPAPRRRGTLPAAADLARVEVEELAIVPEPILEASPKTPSKPQKRERVKHRGVYLLPSQEQAIKRLVAGLSLDDDEPITTNDSEIIRAALDSFLSMTPAAQRATTLRYKASERKRQVGGGWPRPGRAGSKE